MSKYTEEQVKKERRCGLKYLDKVAYDESSRKALIQNMIEIYKQSPGIWSGNDGWSNVSWALGNAVIEKYKEMVGSYKSLSMTWNVSEALTHEEMERIAQELNLNIENYKPNWSRKTSFADLQDYYKEWSVSDSQETLAQMLKKHGWTKKEYIEEEQKLSHNNEES